MALSNLLRDALHSRNNRPWLVPFSFKNKAITEYFLSFYFNIPFPCLKGCIYLFFSQLLYQISLILFLLCSPVALFFSFLDFSPFLLLFIFCFFLHNFNEKHFFSSTILERFSNAYIILLQGRSQELLRTGSFGKLEDKFLESF